MKIKGLTKTVQHKHFPIGLISPTWQKEETPFSKHVKIDDFLKDFLGAFLDVQIDDPDNPGFRTTVKKHLASNWYEAGGWEGHPVPVYLEEFYDDPDILREALAYIYTNFCLTLDDLKTDDLWKIPFSFRKIFREIPTFLGPFAKEMLPADLDFVVAQLHKNPSLGKFCEFLECVDPTEYRVDTIQTVAGRRKKFRKELFTLLVRYAAASEIGLSVERYFSEMKASANQINRDSPDDQVVEAIYENTWKVLNRPFEGEMRLVPYAARPGAVYQLLYPLPKFLESPRSGKNNLTVLSTKKSDHLAQFAGQRMVEVDIVGKVFRGYAHLTDLPNIEPDTYVASVSSIPALNKVPRCILSPDISSSKVDYSFGCSKQCDGWVDKSGDMFFWHPYYRLWLEYSNADRKRFKDFLETHVQVEHRLTFKGASFCPWCGAPLGEGYPYLVRGKLPVSRKAYNYEEDFIEIKSPYTKYHVDLWDRILRFYFKSEYLGEDKLTLVDNYVYRADRELPEEIKEVNLELTGSGLLINGVSYSKQELIYLSFVLYLTGPVWEEAFLSSETVTDFGEEEL